MICITCRRLLFAAPHELTEEQAAHVGECGNCDRLLCSLSGMEVQLQSALDVPMPEALAERVLLAPRKRRTSQFAAAAALFLTVGVVSILPGSLFELFDPPVQVRVSPAHPAVAALTLAANETVGLPQSGDTERMHEELERVGLSLKGDVFAYYAGKCSLREAECDLIFLSTSDAHAKLVLMPNYSVEERVVVDDGQKIALVTPTKGGTYILVADSKRAAKRIQKLIVSG